MQIDCTSLLFFKYFEMYHNYYNSMTNDYAIWKEAKNIYLHPQKLDVLCNYWPTLLKDVVSS